MTGRTTPLPGLTGLGSAVLPGLISPSLGGSAEWSPYSGVWSSTDKATTAAVGTGGFKLSSASGGSGGARGTVVLAEKVYWSVVMIADPGGSGIIGIAPSGMSINTTYSAWSPNGYAYYTTGQLLSTSPAAFGSAWTIGDLITFAYTRSGGRLWISLNGTWQGGGNPLTGANPAVAGLAGDWYPWAGDITGSTVSQFVIIPPAQSAVGLR